MMRDITPFSTLLFDLLFRFLMRGIPIPTYILSDTKGAVIFLYLHPLLSNIGLSVLL